MNEAQTKLKLPKWSLPALAVIALIASIVYLQPLGADAADVEIRESITLEVGEHYPFPDDFLTETNASDVEIYYASDISHVNTRVPGVYPVELKCGDTVLSAEVRVVDTEFPTGTAQDLTLYYPETAAPEEFILDVQDKTNVTVSFREAPDFELEGEQEVYLLLTDEGGNVTELSAKLTMIMDQEPPVITGVEDFLVYQGDTIAYRSGVTVTDDRDTAPTLTVDSSTVDLSSPGEYTVTYTATDYTGNSVSVTATVSVREKQPDFVDLETIYAAADELLAKIIDEDMTTREKVETAALWVRRNCVFVGTSVKDDWLQGAYRMIVNRRGDCFNYFALVKLLLERMDIPNIDVEKVPNYDGDSHHYWSLVSVDGGETYYHVDTTPRKDSTLFILVTDEFMDNYSRKHGNCFNRDTSLYPATPKEPLS